MTRKPLNGVGVVVTRPRRQADTLIRALRALGATVLHCPMITIVPLSTRRLRNALRRINKYGAIIFTSANAANIFIRVCRSMNVSPGKYRHCRMYAVGPSTAEVLKQSGVASGRIKMPRRYHATALLGLIQGVEGLRVLFPRAKVGNEELVRGLRRRGAMVDLIPVYRTAKGGISPSVVRLWLRRRRIDVVTFTSSSAVSGFFDRVPRKDMPFMRGVACVSIGPSTSATLRRYGVKVIVEARRSTMNGLVRAVMRTTA